MSAPRSRSASAAPSAEPIRVEVPEPLSGERLDKALSTLTGLSRREAAELVAGGMILLDGRRVGSRSQKIRAGQVLEAELRRVEEPLRPRADAGVVFGVVHSDRSVIVVDKPAGLVVHPGAGTRRPTLVDGLLARYPDLGEVAVQEKWDPQRPGIVHRLDKGTSGLLVVARTAESHRSLTRQFREHTARRTYVALVQGILEEDEGIVDAPIARSSRRPEQMAVNVSGRPARTRYRVIERYLGPSPVSLIEVELSTGRTHQIRVHLAAIGHGVVGDERYGSPAGALSLLRSQLGRDRLFLHARRLEIDHPEGGRVHWTSELPGDLESALGALVGPGTPDGPDSGAGPGDI